MPCMSFPRTCFSLFRRPQKSNDITTIFVKSILVQKIVKTSIYDSIMSPEHLEINNKNLRLLYQLKIDSYLLCL